MPHRLKSALASADMRVMRPSSILVLLCALLASCDQLGIESASSVTARKEADGKAVGGACRHAGRAIEDCYSLNKRADKAAVYAGWREMNENMRENRHEPVPPLLDPTRSAGAVLREEPSDPALPKPAGKPRSH